MSHLLIRKEREMSSAAYAGPIRNVVVVMMERRSYDDALGLLYDPMNATPFDDAPAGQRALDARDAGGPRPPMLPITAFLANRFMVCDRWFASTPAGGAANVLFAHCAVRGECDGDVLDIEPNVFSALDTVRPRARAGVPSWKVYFHDYSILGNALAYVARRFADRDNVNVANYDECDYPPGSRNPLANPTTTFLQDVAQGMLPAYAFIESRHGGLPRRVALVGPRERPRTEPSASQDAFESERLLLEVYLALRHSPFWERTLLLVFSDAPGKTADHVSPPETFGGRIPAIVVSPYVSAGTTLRAAGPFDHVSIVKTLWHCFDLRASGREAISERDANAPTILDHLDGSIVNQPGADPAELSAAL
jgi:phospholipase C